MKLENLIQKDNNKEEPYEYQRMESSRLDHILRYLDHSLSTNLMMLTIPYGLQVRLLVPSALRGLHSNLLRVVHEYVFMETEEDTTKTERRNQEMLAFRLVRNDEAWRRSESSPKRGSKQVVSIRRPSWNQAMS